MNRILITGANRGIGLNLCRQFLALGWQVLAACRKPDAAHALRALPEAQAPDQLRILPLDVSDAASVRQLATQLHNVPLDVLVNNAGVMAKGPQALADIDFEHWQHTLDVNTLGPFRVITALLDNLRLSSHPRIITVSSQLGAFSVDFVPGHYAYASSKAAVSKAMQLLAMELETQGVICCPVHPGWVQTDMGGPDADITPEASARGLCELICRLEMRDSGTFFTWDGQAHAW